MSFQKSMLTGFAAGLALCSFAASARADLVISNDPTQNMNCSGGVCTATAGKALLNVTDLANLLAASDVTVKTVYFKNRSAHDIAIVAPLSWTSATKLTLTTASNRSTFIQAPVSVLGKGGLVVSYRTIFALNAPVTFWDLGSTFSIGGTAYTLIGDFPTLASDIAANPKGQFALANDYDAGSDRFRKAPIPTFSSILLGLDHTISNLTISKGSKLCEGMIGTNNGSISFLTLNNVSVKLDSRSRYVGAIAGCNKAVLSNVAVSGQVTSSADSDAGGIAGINTSGISSARSLANVAGGQAGGIAGENDNGISDVSAGGTISGVIDTGGLVGANNGDIGESYAFGNVSGSENNTGGLVGSNRGVIGNCYAMGNVIGGPGASGGLIGFNGGSVSTSYSTGQVAGGAGYTGGFAGYDPNEGIAHGYWDTDSSGITDPAQGAGFPQYDPGITGLTTAQLKAGVPFGFDHNYWRADANINNGYPYLRFDPPQ